MASKQLEVYVNNELMKLNVSEAEFLAATTGNQEVIKVLVDRENERRSMLLINEEQDKLEQFSYKSFDKPEQSSINASCGLEVNENSKKESFIWSDQAVLLFLDIYRNKEPEFNSGLKRHNKIWQDIANEMKESKYDVTATQCQNKLSGLKRTYKNISDSNKKSGNHASSWAFYSTMDSIFGEKAWVEPAAIASSDTPSPRSSFSEKSFSSDKSTIDKIGSMGADEPKPKKRRVETILESFIDDIKANKENEKEEKERHRAEKIERQNQMHRKRIQLQQSLIELLSKIAERK